MLLFFSSNQLKANEKVVRSRAVFLASQHFPEIKTKKLRFKTFSSETSFFKARFSIVRFATFQRMRHLLFYNPKAFELRLSEEALDSILVHELAHVSYYTRKNRFQLLGLVGLVRGSREIQFERKADLEVLKRGFGSGLKQYRKWLYKNIPAKSVVVKKRVYLTPEEIDVAIRVKDEKPALFKKWQRKVPLNIEAMRADSGYE